MGDSQSASHILISIRIIGVITTELMDGADFVGKDVVLLCGGCWFL